MKSKKPFISLLLVVALIFSMIVPVSAATEPALTATPSVTQINQGTGTADVIYTISINPNGNKIAAFQFTLGAPEGMTLATNRLTSGITNQGGDGYWEASKALEFNRDDGTGYFTTFSYTPSTGYFGASGGIDGRTMDNTSVIMTIKATVDISTVKTYTLNVTDFICYGVGSVNQGGSEPVVTDVKITAAPKPATGISLNKSTLELTVGGSETLVATVEPNDTTDTVTWTSSATGVATVDTNGKVTAVATGTATITAKAGSKSATCDVTVENAPCTHTNKTNVAAKPSTCKEMGWEAYSKCDDCRQLFDKDGNEISAIPYLSLADHTPAQTATAEYLKSAATCTSPAVYYEHCSVCDEKLNTTFTSGSTVPHTESGWKSAADGHWKACTVCNQITTTKTAHTPDHTGQATEEYAIKCTECGYVIEAQLGHTHVFDQEVATDAYKATNATCTAKATYYKSCACGEKGTETFEHGELAEHNWTPATCTASKTCSVCQATEGDPLGHTEDPEWKYNSTSHWHVCTVCGAKTDEPQEHQFDGGKICVDCRYTKGSTIVFLDPADTDKPDLENPGTGAAVSGSSIGYVCAALAAVSAIYVGAKKLAKKDEE